MYTLFWLEDEKRLNSTNVCDNSEDRGAVLIGYASGLQAEHVHDHCAEVTLWHTCKI